MKKINISSIIYYGRNYNGCSFDDGKIRFYLNLDDLEIYNRKFLIQEYNFTDEILSDELTLQYTYRFIPIFQVDIIKEIKNFFENMKNRRISREIKDLNPDQLYIYFEDHMELNLGSQYQWGEYEWQCLTVAAVNWCKHYHIPYVL